VTVSSRRSGRREPPPSPGTVEVRVHGSPADVDAFLAELGRVLPLGEATWRVKTYTVDTGRFQYLKVQVPSSPPPP
jgi:hypothetical protein